MRLTEDYCELLSLLADCGARHVVVGAYAMAVHGAPRYTGDIDILIEPTPENARRVREAIVRFGFGELDISIDDLSTPDMVIQLGVAPCRVDLVTSLSGVSFDEAWNDRVEHECGGQVIPFMSKAMLIANKHATGRLRDLADIEALEQAPE